MSGLENLRDVDGVFGSFVMSSDGKLVARDLPEMFADETLTDAAGRIQRLMLLSEAMGENPESMVLTFRDYRLFLRGGGPHLLGVIAENRASTPALRMAMTLLLRRFASPTLDLRGRAPSAPSLPQKPMAPTPAPPSVRASMPSIPESTVVSKPNVPAPVRTYRGRPIS